MAPSTLHRAFFGDAERDFVLTPAMIVELERATGKGIGTLFKGFFAGEFSSIELSETIRLALIGANENPKDAKVLVDAYVSGRPVNETFPLAVSIFEKLWFGSATAQPDEAPQPQEVTP